MKKSTQSQFQLQIKQRTDRQWYNLTSDYNLEELKKKQHLWLGYFGGDGQFRIVDWKDRWKAH